MGGTALQTLPDPPQPALAADAAVELMKQLITLSSGVLALSATFIDRLAPAGLWSVALLLAWLCLIAALIAALETISAIVKSRLEPGYDWSTGRGQKSAQISKYGFVVGIALVAAVGWGSLSRGAVRDSNRSSSNTVYTLSQQAACPARHRDPTPNDPRSSATQPRK